MCIDCHCITTKAKTEIDLISLDKNNDCDVNYNSKMNKDAKTDTIKPLFDCQKKKNRRIKSCNKLNKRNETVHQNDECNDSNDNENEDEEVHCEEKNNNNDIVKIFKENDQKRIPPRSIKSSNILKGVRNNLMKNAF